MHIEQPHTLGRQPAVDRVQQAVAQLLQMPLPGGVTVKDVSQQWNGNQLDFSFKAAKGFMGATIKGRAVVSDDTVALDIDLPPLVAMFVSEETIRGQISDRLAAVLRQQV